MSLTPEWWVHTGTSVVDQTTAPQRRDRIRRPAGHDPLPPAPQQQFHQQRRAARFVARMGRNRVSGFDERCEKSRVP